MSQIKNWDQVFILDYDNWGECLDENGQRKLLKGNRDGESVFAIPVSYIRTVRICLKERRKGYRMDIFFGDIGSKNIIIYFETKETLEKGIKRFNEITNNKFEDVMYQTMVSAIKASIKVPTLKDC